MEIEISNILDISNEERKYIELHSFINILNVLMSNVYNLQLLDESTNTLSSATISIKHIADIITKNDLTRSHIDIIEKSLQQMIDDLTNFIQNNGLQDHVTATGILNSIKSTVAFFNFRLRELRERLREPNVWKEYSIEQIKYEFYNFILAMEQNAKGKYNIVYGIAVPQNNTYMISFHVNSIFQDRIYMPIVFRDVIRDLTANAKKYTPIGGMIIAGLSQDDKSLRFAIEDNGIGIPEDELSKVVEFKYRATNASSIKTFGNGFGLTKAYLVTKELGGKMYIKSSPNNGTRIIIEIPNKMELT